MSVEKASAQQQLRAAATGKVITSKEPTSFPQMLTAYKSQIQAALPKHISGDRMLRVALTAFRQNEKLAECDPRSVFACIVVASQLGLEPGVLGQCYLVPFKNQCTLVPGWQGYCDLVNRSGRASVWTGAVFDGDKFEYEYGSNPHIHHIPAGNDDQPERLTHCYAVGKVKGAELPVIEVWSVSKITRHRDRYNKVGSRHYSYNNFEMYGRKVALMQILKYMPKSIEMSSAFASEYAADAGQTIDLKEAMDGTFLPAPVEHVVADQPKQEEKPAAPEKTAEEHQPAPVASNGAEEDDEPMEYDAPKGNTAQIAFLKKAGTVQDLADRWHAIKERYPKNAVPLEVESAMSERREFINSRDVESTSKRGEK